jgi:TIR domain
MPDNGAPLEDYAVKYQGGLSALLQLVPDAKRDDVIKLLDTLTANPNQYVERTKSAPTDPSGQTRVYTHSDNQLEITYKLEETIRRITFIHVAYRLVELRQIFISYSHTDTKWRDLIQKFLKPLNSNVVVWDDSKIQVGGDWFKEIESAMSSARAAVFLVTQDFLNSDFISRQELPTMLERAKQDGHVAIIWVAIKPCTVMDSPLGKYQGLHASKPLASLKGTERDDALVAIYQIVKKAMMEDAGPTQ